MKKTVRDIDIKGKRILLRADFNVPLDNSLHIVDDARIKAALPTLRYILKNGARKLILMSHLGRPDGKVVENLRLDPIANRLKDLLGEAVIKFNGCIDEDTKRGIGLSKERVVLLENLRFHPEEEDNDLEFSRNLASLGDIYVNDAFGTAHRAHASTEGITHYLPSVAGFLMENEIKNLSRVLEYPDRPLMVILGGAKVSDKIGVIKSLLLKTDSLLIGGGMAYTFLKAMGKSIGSSRLEKDKLELAGNILDEANRQGVKVFLPVDHLVADKVEMGAQINVTGENILNGWIGVDIGPKTIAAYSAILEQARTIVWNGPLGVFEIDSFGQGTRQIAEFIGTLKGVTTIIGGGDTAAAIAKFKLEERMTHISTGGGASLEFLEGKTLPGIAALADKL